MTNLVEKYCMALSNYFCEAVPFFVSKVRTVPLLPEKLETPNGWVG